MICIDCGGENRASFRFCCQCGRALGQTCLACGFENSAESRFCGGCAARLHEVRLEDGRGERRQLTVLFCDIVGSTHLAEVLDPEDLGELIGAYQKVCTNAAHVHEGHIAQYLGDGVVIYFGYPRSHEDEAQRAIRCGLDILAGVRALHESVRPSQMTALDVRLGAHTGRVVVGPVGAGDRTERVALGETPNVAQRIQAEAEPGTLTVSDVTWRMVEGYFTGKCLGKAHLRGVSEPIQLWLVTGESPSRDRIEAAPSLTPFVGRERELSALKDCWDRSQAGQSQFVLLRGDPGMGKSRLAQLLQEHVEAAGAEVLRMRATPQTINSPFRPVIELIEDRVQLDQSTPAGDRLDRLAAGLECLGLGEPETVVLFASLLAIPTEDRYPQLPLSPARQRSRTMELLVEALAVLARSGPTLLLVEDLHWMDTSTLEFLELLVTRAPTGPLLGVLTARPELHLDWFATSNLRTVELHRLTWSEAEEMVRGVTAEKALPGEVLRQIIVRSDGVPLFVEELTLSVLGSGMLSERAASWEVVGPVSSEMIPATMDASLTSRIDRLGASRATAQLAATIGREFTSDLLRRVSDRDEVTVRHDLEELLKSGLARPVEDDNGTFEFKHALVRDAAYNTLLRSTRQSYHRRIATALREAVVSGGGQRPELIATHLTNAGENEEAISFWKVAGHQALERGAVREAAEHFRHAIDCLGLLPVTPKRQEQELELQILLAPLLMAVYGWGAREVEAACERGLALAQELERYDLSYPSLWGLWTVRFLRGDLASAMEAAETVLGVAQASGVPMLQITGHHAVSYTLAFRGEFEGAVEEADAGLALFDIELERQLTNTFQLSSAVSMGAARGHSLWMLGRVTEAEDQWAWMLQLARDIGHPANLAAALAFSLHSAYRYSYAGQMERLGEIAAELTELAREESFFLWCAVALSYRGLIGLTLGDERAEAQVKEGLELMVQTRTQLTFVQMNVLWAEALCRLGRDERAWERLDVAEAEMRSRQEGLCAPEIWRLRGGILARRGQMGAAEATYREAMGRASAQHALSLELRATLDLYDLQHRQERPEEALSALSELSARFVQGPDGVEQARAAEILRSSLTSHPT